MLTQERLKELISYDSSTGIFTRLKTTSSKAMKGSNPGTATSNGYLKFSVDGRSYFSHRLAWLYVYGKFPVGILDHINSDRKDNRIANLRQVTLSQNGCNRLLQSTNRSGIKGVSWEERAGQWKAVIMLDGKQKRLGYFKNKSEAATAIAKARLELHGEFANFGHKGASQ